MPEADKITFGFSLRLIILDSSEVIVVRNPWKISGLIPCSTRASASASKQDFTFLLNTLVASIASGLST